MDQDRKDYGELDRPRRRPAGRGLAKNRLRAIVVPLLSVGVLVAFCAGYLLGSLRECQRQYRAKFERDQAAIAPVLAADPAFAGVRIQWYDGGGILLEGGVPTPADGKRLRAEFVRLFGELEVWRAGVRVKQTGQFVFDMGG